MSNDPAVERGVHPFEVDAADAGPRPPVDPRWRTAAFASAAVFALNAMALSTWISRLPATRDRLDLDAREIGLTLLMAGVGSLAVMPFVGRLASRWGGGRVTIVAAVATAVALLALAVSPSALTTGLVLFLFGAANGSWDVAMNIQGSFVDRQAGRDYMPRYHACWSVGAAVGAALGALSAAAGVSLLLHFSVVAFVCAGGTLLIVVRWWVDDREPIAAPEIGADGEPVRRGRLLTKRLVLIGAITLCACLLEGAAADWIALYLTDERDAAQSLAALGYGMWAAAMALSRFSGTTLIARMSRPRAVRLAGAVVLAGVVATLAAPGIPGALIGVVLWGAGVALVFPAAMSAGGETPGRAADGIATVSTIGYGGFLIGPPLIGLVAHEIGLGRALWLLPVLGVGIILLAPVVKPPARPTA